MLEEATISTPRWHKNKHYFIDRTQQAKQLEFDRYQSFMRVDTPNITLHDNQIMFSDDRLNQAKYGYLVDYNVDHFQTNFDDATYSMCAINGYVNYTTDGLIENLVRSCDFIDIRLLMISTVHFRGKWKVIRPNTICMNVFIPKS